MDLNFEAIKENASSPWGLFYIIVILIPLIAFYSARRCIFYIFKSLIFPNPDLVEDACNPKKGGFKLIEIIADFIAEYGAYIIILSLIIWVVIKLRRRKGK